MESNISGPYISKVMIKNFRNFKNYEGEKVDLSHKQVIIGENNVGKTNFLRAIQLILDPKLSDEDRTLVETDFYEGLDSPMENGEEIEISIDIRGFDHNKNLLAILSDGAVIDNPRTIRLTYKYYATLNKDGTYIYQYKIFQGDNEDTPFNHYHRRYLNIKVIPPIRDVESELRNSRKSPITQLIREYEINKEELEGISESLKETSEEVLDIDELKHLTININNKFSTIIRGQVPDSKISLETMDLDPNRILNTLKIMLGEIKRPTSDTSLGLTNILYISLVLLSLEDKTIPAILQKETYNKLLAEENSDLLEKYYTQNIKSQKYLLNNELSKGDYKRLYSFMEDNLSSNRGLTILAIEEPEAHLHPSLQRVIYKDVMESSTSVLMTTHSPYITSVAPLESIVHLRLTEEGTSIKTTASIKLGDRDKKDLERYIDVKKGEIYFGKGVILVEGVAEEYLIPKFAELLGYNLDEKGIICCNINSTNFKPYAQHLKALGIPYVIITDGDYYYNKEEKNNGKINIKKVYHKMFSEEHYISGFGYDGLERTKELLLDLNEINDVDIPDNINEEDDLYRGLDIFIGCHTLEIDIMDASVEENSKDVFIRIFNDLTAGGKEQKRNFKDTLQKGDFVACLRKIESAHSEIGKGRFAQTLSTECSANNIPEYIEAAIERIYFKVDGEK